MTRCSVCGSEFDPAGLLLDDPAVEAGWILAHEKFADAGSVCRQCLLNRGRLAMMYDPDLQF